MMLKETNEKLQEEIKSLKGHPAALLCSASSLLLLCVAMISSTSDHSFNPSLILTLSPISNALIFSISHALHIHRRMQPILPHLPSMHYSCSRMQPILPHLPMPCISIAECNPYLPICPSDALLLYCYD